MTPRHVAAEGILARFMERTDDAMMRSDASIAELKSDVGHLQGSDLEMKVHRRIRPLLGRPA